MKKCILIKTKYSNNLFYNQIYYVIFDCKMDIAVII